MPELPQRKVGIVACSGEELAEGTVTRLAALRVLEQLRPSETVTICLPLFLAGGEGDRAFARFYPTIALDGCDKRCAARATEQYSGKPAASIVVSDLVSEAGLDRPVGARRLDESGRQAVVITADRVAGLVDELLAGQWSRRSGSFVEAVPAPTPGAAPQAGCACASAIPVQTVDVDGQAIPLAGPAADLRAVPRGREVTGSGRDTGAAGDRADLQRRAGRDRYGACCRPGARVRGVLRPGGGALVSRTSTYQTTLTWTGEHRGHITMGNGPEMDFSAPPDAEGHAGVLTPEDAFVAAANTCVMLMFIWATERFKLDLASYECRAEGTKLIELDRTETFTHLRLWPLIRIRAGAERPEVVEARARRAMQSAQKYSLVANSVKSEVIVEPTFEIVS